MLYPTFPIVQIATRQDMPDKAFAKQESELPGGK
jgi:hypothetical protein